jgi:regulator of RNase E activity RraA
MRVASSGAPVDCAGVTVSPGDAVVADDDGVVIVPSALIGEVAAIALARARSEDRVLEELLGGASLREVWDRHRVL